MKPIAILFSGLVFLSAVFFAPRQPVAGATSSGEEQQRFVDEALVPPEVLSAKLTRAGKEDQVLSLSFRIFALVADSTVDRYLALRVRMRRGDHWAYLDNGQKSTWQSGGEHFDGASEGGPSIVQNVHTDSDDYRWICGKRKPPVILQTANWARSESGELLGGRVVRSTKVKVYGAKCIKKKIR